jgi:RimJ/RimL family protein N-acetyltransferase
VGQIQARVPKRSVPLPPGFFSLGIVIYRPEDRSRGIGRPALEVLIEWLFEHVGAEGLQAATTPSNEPMRHLLRSLGFKEGARIDILGLEESLFEITRAAWESERRETPRDR